MPHKKSKHFGLEWAHAKQSIANGELKLAYVPTDEQAADILTKQIPAKQFIYLRDKVMGGQGKQEHFETSMIISSAFILGNQDVDLQRPPNVSGPLSYADISSLPCLGTIAPPIWPIELRENSLLPPQAATIPQPQPKRKKNSDDTKKPPGLPMLRK